MSQARVQLRHALGPLPFMDAGRDDSPQAGIEPGIVVAKSPSHQRCAPQVRFWEVTSIRSDKRGCGRLIALHMEVSSAGADGRF
jgi:hypothetical protein